MYIILKINGLLKKILDENITTDLYSIKKETAFSIEKVESKSNFLNFNLICKSFSGVFCEH